jgi:hypothetical protein
VSSEAPFPLGVRLAAAAWLAVFVGAYWATYGPANFLHICDVAVILTCVGLMRGSSLLLSSQALASLMVDLAWDLDLAWRAATGRHLVGGTEYMWESRFPLAVRLLSCFHVFWPLLLLWALRRVGYDRRALPVQTVLTAILLVASYFVLPQVNINFARANPFTGTPWGPPPVHLALSLLALVAVVYWPTHRLLNHFFPRSEVERLDSA